MPLGRTGPRLRGWTPAPAGPRSPPSAWLEDLLERLPSKSSKHTKQVCQSISPSKSSKQVFRASLPPRHLLGRLAWKTCSEDMLGRLDWKNLPGVLGSLAWKTCSASGQTNAFLSFWLMIVSLTATSYGLC